MKPRRYDVADLLTREQEDALLGKPAVRDQYDTVIRRPAHIYADGKLVMALLPVEEDVDYIELVESLHRINYITDYRTDGLKSTSRIFGYQHRIPLRRDFCSTCSMAREHTYEHDLVAQYGVRAAERFAEVRPDLYAAQKDLLAEEVLPLWRMPGDIFTSGIINKNAALRHHRDAGNFQHCWSCMYVFSRDMRGGMLVVPRYRIALEFCGADLVMFDGAALMHGVTKIKRMNRQSYRYSVVFYALKGMAKCGTREQELARVRRLKTERAELRTSDRKDELKQRIAKSGGGVRSKDE